MPTTNGKEQPFNFGIKNNDTRDADTTADFLVTQNADGTHGKIDPDDIISTVPDATTTVKGKIKLAGDLAGTAELPTVPGLMGAPNYFYYADSFYKSDVGKSKTTPHNTISSATQKPTNVVLIGDSLMGVMANSFQDAAAPFGGLNSIGFNPFYQTNYGTLISVVNTGTVTPVRNDTTSNGSWGVCGSRVDASNASTITITPVAKYRFNAFHLWYNKKSGSGTFTYSIDGAATVSVDTNNASEVLGILSVSTGISGSSTHTIVLTVTSGDVTFYGIDLYNKAQSGLVFHVLQSGGSQAAQWAGRTDYARQFIALLDPVECVVFLGANDAGASRTASQYTTDLTTIINDLSLPITCAPVIMTPTPRGLTPLGAEDTAFTTLINTYRDSALTTAKANSWSFFDSLKYFPSYTNALARNMYIDEIHYSVVGAWYMASKLTGNLFREFNNYDFYRENTLRKTSILFEPDDVSGFSSIQNNTDGSKTETGSGLYFAGTTMNYKNGFVKQMQFSNNGLANAIASFFPSTATPSVLYSLRQNSTTAKCFSIDVVGTVPSLTTNNATFTINSTGLYSNTLLGVKTTAALAPLHILGSGADNITPNSDVIQDAVIMGPATTGNTGNLSVQSNSTSGIDIGGSIGLGGRYRSSIDGRWATFGMIKGLKENSTDADNAGYLSFLTKANGGTQTQKLGISSTGEVKINTVPVTSAGTYDILTRNTTSGNVEKITSASVQPTITATTSADYYRGDKTMQPLNGAVIGSFLTGFSAGSGTVSSTDTVLQGFNKLAGNQALKANLTDVSIQQIVDNTNRYAELDGGNSQAYELYGSANARTFSRKIGDGGDYSEIKATNTQAFIQNENVGVSNGLVDVSNGLVTMSQSRLGFGISSIAIDPALVNTTWSTPAFSVAGSYKYASQPKEYLVSALPTPTGSDSRFAIVTDALAPSYMVAIVGGGSVVCPVFYNGSGWVAN